MMPTKQSSRLRAFLDSDQDMHLTAIFAAQWESDSHTAMSKTKTVSYSMVNIAFKDDLHPINDAWDLPGPARDQAASGLARDSACLWKIIRTGMMTGDPFDSCYCVIPDIKLTEKPERSASTAHI